MAVSSRFLAASDSSTTNSQGRVWCGAGAVHAARTASSSVPRGTVPGPKERMVRRDEMNESGDSRNRSSSRGRTRSRAKPGGPSPRTPRTMTAGIRSAFPMASPPAAATSSARATTVASSTRPVWSLVPRRSTSAGNPAHPMATFTRPRRHARPNVSVTTTPTEPPAA